MRSEILEKLNKELSDLPIDTEPRAMYLLVQIRKIMDHLEDGDNPLRFYCNWVVHIVLKRSAAQEKLNTLDKMSDARISRFITLAELRKYLASFLKEHGLSDVLTKTEKYWSKVSGIPRNQFFKTYVKPSSASLHKRNTLPLAV